MIPEIAAGIKKYGIKYENLLLLLASLTAALIILTPAYFQQLESFILSFREYGYLGAAVMGFFFSYGITTPIAMVGLAAFGSVLDPLFVALVGGTAAAISDFIIYFFARRKLSAIERKIEKRFLSKKYSSVWHAAAPIVAGFIIASPLPDELAAGILGALRFDKKRFLIFVWVAEVIGIFIIASVGKIF
ncbi:MAG TPA: VTT domain-containing protein [archaeon]|nr:VTT domain-containing protein [archaeon]